MHRSKIIGILLLCLAAVCSGKAFNGARAYEFTAKAVGFGPRPPDSAANHKLQAYILAQLKTRGCAISEDSFVAKAPQGPVPMKNIICKFPGQSGKAIVFSGHYDTKTIPGFVGANDGGSSTGFLLEMGEALAGSVRKDDVYLVFFDGEEAYGEWSDANSLYGSRHLAEKWAEDGTLRKVKALINVDMIGDKELSLAWNSGSSPALQMLVWGTAARMGYAENFPHTGGVTGDDHVPFIDRGVQALDLIDFEGDFWHTTRDTMDKLGVKSFQILGNVLMTVLKELEEQN
jgi:glutaminyl-peptide cyclotransferase